MRQLHQHFFRILGFALAVTISVPLTLFLGYQPDGSPAPGRMPQGPVARTPCYEGARIRLTLNPHTDVPTPDYAIEISESGDVTFEGKHLTRVLGVHHTKTSRATVRRLIAEAYRIGFFSYADEYVDRDLGNGFRSTVDHAIGYTIEVETALDYKSVYHFFGGPSELEEFKNHIIAAGDPNNWRESRFEVHG